MNRVENLRKQFSDREAVYITSFANIFYYSGFQSDDGALLISHDKAILITDSRYTVQAAVQSPDFEVHNITEGLQSIVSVFSGMSIGYEEDYLTMAHFQTLQETLPNGAELVPMQKKISALRQVKDEAEIAHIREAERIGDEAFSYVLPRIRPGVSEREIALEIEFFMKKQGATALSFDTICASGVRSAMPHGVATEKRIETGDFVTLDFGCVFEGYCSDMTRTVVVGKADTRQKEIYDIVLRAQLAAIDALAQGKRCVDIDAVARNLITEAGFGKEFGHSLGHSVGIEIHEAPSLSPKSEAVLTAGNVITVEPGIYVSGFGGVRIEDLLVVGEGKNENLTHSTKELLIV